MKDRSERRQAELAVLEAAHQWLSARVNYTNEYEACQALSDAVSVLDNLGYGPLPAPRAAISAPETSHQAAEWMRQHQASVAGRVLSAILLAWRRGSLGLTAEQVMARLQGKHQTISARVNELRNAGLIVDSGARRQTTSGRMAVVWTPTGIVQEAETATYFATREAGHGWEG